MLWSGFYKENVMRKFISDSNLSEKEFIEKYLPVDSNSQDKIYLKTRYSWIRNEIEYKQVSISYQGTTFQKNFSYG